MSLLALTGVSVQLDRKTIVHEASLAVDSGQLVGLVGPNGAGKTTLLRAAAGLLRPRTGTIQIGGRDTAGLDHAAMARAVAYLPHGAPCHWPMTVRDVVALGRLPYTRFLRRHEGNDTAAIDRAMELSEVTGFADRRVNTLSAGERARVLIARALAQGTPLLLADEPTAALDPFHQLRVMAVLGRLAAEGKGILAVFHDLPLAARFCHRIAVLVRGRIVAAGKPADVLTADLIRSAYGVEMNSNGTFTLPETYAE